MIVAVFLGLLLVADAISINGVSHESMSFISFAIGVMIFLNVAEFILKLIKMGEK